jgi:NAD(P)H-dependent flavin oxidoreductase YrpB (nitropropane dioxygenase family)
VPLQTKERYVAASTDDIFVTDRLDGAPQRMIRNKFTARLEGASRLRMLSIAIGNALRLRRLTGASVVGMLNSARAIARSGHASLGQALMAANAPVLIQRAVEQGKPDEGVMATGQVAGRLNDLPSCEELVQRIVRDAEHRLDALLALSKQRCDG